MPQLYFFGCSDRIGHFLINPAGSERENVIGPFDVNGDRGLPIDGRFAPGVKSQDETAVALTHVQGWTVLAMWDRTVDNRGASNAAFFIEGLRSMDEMWALARQHYPQIVARLKAAKSAQEDA